MKSNRSLFTRLAPTGGALLLMLLAAAPARAQTTTSTDYSASKCFSASRSENANFVRDDGAQTIKNNAASGTFRVYCPITKKTSGPSIVAADGISSVAIGLKSAGAVSCSIETRRVPVVQSNDVNRILPAAAGSRSTVGTLTLTAAAGRPVGYWGANATQAGQPAWYYSYLTCTLAPGATIGKYTVVEDGSSTGNTIDSFISCPLTSDMEWRFEDFLQAGGNAPTGYVLAQASGSAHQFSLACAGTKNPPTGLPNNAWAQVAFGPSANLAGCNLNNSNLSTMTWSTVRSSGAAYPTVTAAGAYEPVISLPLAQTNTLTCGQTSTLGDSKWFSYRVFANPSHKMANNQCTTSGKWCVSASHNSGAAPNAIDADSGTRWSSNTAGKAGMTFTVDLGPAWTGLFNQITFDSGADGDDYPRQFTVLVSYDGSNFFPVTNFTANNHFATANMSEQPARWFQIRVDKDIKNAAGATKYWSIREINIYYNNGQ